MPVSSRCRSCFFMNKDCITSPHTIVLQTSPHTIVLNTSPHTIVLNTSPHTIGLNTSSHTIGLNTSPHTIGLNTSSHAIGFNTSPHTIGLNSNTFVWEVLLLFLIMLLGDLMEKPMLNSLWRWFLHQKNGH